MSVSLYLVDAFTGMPFRGNPAAVCLLHKLADEEWMQNVAAEMNHSETAFVYPEQSGYGIRWFTPTTEVELCGHAALASVHVLHEVGIIKDGEDIIFHAGDVHISAKCSDGRIEMDFPTLPVDAVETPEGLVEAIGVEPVSCSANKCLLLVELADEDAVRSFKPDFARIAAIDAPCLLITARSDSDAYDFASRFFAPRMGVNEDPVTGSAHCSLGVYWQARLGKSEMIGYQASSRGGVVGVRVEGDRTFLSGMAVTIMTGVLI
ncbi:MAG: PhzF family phenazine biosynthesis protein [Armatimonadota bacterium]